MMMNRPPVRIISLLLTALMLAGGSAGARKVRVGPSRLVRQSVEAAGQARAVSVVACPPGAIRCSGYDKPNGASKETFFVSNLMASDSLPVEGLIITLDYSDMSGRQLHRARHEIKLTLPPGETRAVGVTTWDPNRAFHYYRSEAPKRRRSTPYRVSAVVDSLIVSRGAE